MRPLGERNLHATYGDRISHSGDNDCLLALRYNQRAVETPAHVLDLLTLDHKGNFRADTLPMSTTLNRLSRIELSHNMTRTYEQATDIFATKARTGNKAHTQQLIGWWV